MRRKTNKRSKSSSRRKHTKKQKPIMMIGCSKKKRVFSSKLCKKCASNCRCGPKCNCKHKCPGNCYMKMKGGSGCGSCGCPIAPYAIKGGFANYTKTDQPVLIDGTNVNKYGQIIGTGQNGGQMPGPFVGSPWNANNWPGMDGIGSNRNYFSAYDTTKDPSYQMSMNDSGYNTKSSMVGGGLVPQDLVNLGRDLTFNVKSAYNALNGYSAPVNPLPYKDQLTSSNKILI